MNFKEKSLTWFKENGIDSIDAMNFLQSHGLVSDNAIDADDVCDRDWGLVHYFILSGAIQDLIDQDKEWA